MDELLTAALSGDNKVRRGAEATLRSAQAHRGFAIALARALADGDGDRSLAARPEEEPKRLMAGVLLQQFVRDRWELAGDIVLPREDKTQVRSMVSTTMVDFSASRAARASAARVVALMAAGGEWPSGWGGLIPSLLGQLALAAATVSQAKAGEALSGGGAAMEHEAGSDGAGAGAAPVVAGDPVAEGVAAAAAAAAAGPTPEHVEYAVARAESCAKCLQYMTEEVQMKHVPELFQQAFPGLVQAGKAGYLPRHIQVRVFRIVRELFLSIGTLISVRGQASLLPGLKQCVPPWLQLVSKTLQSAVDGLNHAAAAAGGGAGAGMGASAGEEAAAGEGDGFGVELEGLRTAMALLEHVPSTVGDGHLGQLLPPLWELLTNGWERHERSMLSVSSGGGEDDCSGDGDGGADDDDDGYASDGERQGFEELIVHSLELLAATAACPDPHVSGLLGGEGAGVGSLLAVVIRYLQLPSESCELWRDSPNEFVVTELDEGEGGEDGEGAGAGAGAGGRAPASTARSAGLALIRDLCESFPEKAVPALIAEAKAALVDSSAVVISPTTASAAAGGGGGGGEGTGGAGSPAAPAAAAAAVSARRWRLREAALLCLGAASKPITRQVKRRCPLAVKLKNEQKHQKHTCSNANNSNGGGGGGGGGGGNHHHHHHHNKDNNNNSNNHVGASSTSSSCTKAASGEATAGGGGGGAGEGGKCKHKKAAASGDKNSLSVASFSPGTLCRGARGLGLDLGGFQAVIVAAAEGRSHHAEEPSSPFVHARGLWATARFASLLSAEGVCRAAEACSLAMGEGRPLCLRLHACKALRVLGQYSARIARKGGFFGIKRGAGKALLGSRVGAAARAAVTAAPGLALCCEEGTAHFAPETMTQLVKGFPAEAVAQGGALVLLQLSMTLWLKYPSDPLVVEAVEDLLLALSRIPQAIPQMIQTLVPFFSGVFERVRSGEEDLHAVAEGCLSLLRELITRSTAAPAGAGGGRWRGSRSHKGGRSYDASVGASAPKKLLDSSGRRSLSEGLRVAFPLLLETDSYSLVQDGCSTLQEFVTAFGLDIASNGPSGAGPAPPRGDAFTTGLPANTDKGDRNAHDEAGTRGALLAQHWSESPVAAASRDPTIATATGAGSWNDGGEGAGGMRGVGREVGGELRPKKESGGGGGGEDSALSLVLAFLARVMAPGAHEASALRTGGLVSAVLTYVPPRSLGRETVQSLLYATFDKLERCSSSLLGDELLQVFVSFVNSDEYGPNALADAFVEIEQGRRRRAGALGETGNSVGGGRPVVARGSGTRRGIRLFATPPAAAAPQAPQATMMPAAGKMATTLSTSNPTTATDIGGGGSGEGLLLSAPAPFLSVERRSSSGPAAATSAAVAVRHRSAAHLGRGHGGDDAVASLRRLIGLWLFFHEMVRSPSLAKRSALGLLGLLKAAGEGDARLYTLRVSTDSMGSGAASGAGVRARYLPPSLRKMEGELLPVCLLSSIVRTAQREDEVDSRDGRGHGGRSKGQRCSEGPGASGGGGGRLNDCDDGGAIFSLENEEEEEDEDAMMDEGGYGSTLEDTDGSDDDDDSYDEEDDDYDYEEEDDDEEESDTEDVTDEGEMSMGSGEGGGGGGGSDRRPPYYHGTTYVDRQPLALETRTVVASLPSSSTTSPASSGLEAMAQVSVSLPASMSVDRGRLLASSATSAPEFSCFAGASSLTRCSSSNSFTAPSTHGGFAGGGGGGGSGSVTARVSSAPTTGSGAGQLLSSSCPRDMSWLTSSAGPGGGDGGGGGGGFTAQQERHTRAPGGFGGGQPLSTIQDSRRNRRHQHQPQQEEPFSASDRQVDDVAQELAGGGGVAWADVKRVWSETGVGRGLVRFLRSTTGTPSEALLCGWAGMLPTEEQATLTSLLRPE